MLWIISFVLGFGFFVSMFCFADGFQKDDRFFGIFIISPLFSCLIANTIYSISFAANYFSKGNGFINDIVFCILILITASLTFIISSVLLAIIVFGVASPILQSISHYLYCRPNNWFTQKLVVRKSNLKSTDDFGKLYNYRMPFSYNRLSIVEVINSTPDAKGKKEKCYLCVPPTHYFISPKNAIAWTFGLSGNNYNPILET